jgi:hypothetical protein
MECLARKEARDTWQISLIDDFIAQVTEYDLLSGQGVIYDSERSKKESLISGLNGLKSKPRKQLVMEEIKQLYGGTAEYKRIKDIIKASFGKRNEVLHEGRDVSREEVERLDKVANDLLRHRIKSLPKRRLFDDLF